MGLGDWLLLHAVEVAFILLLCLMPYFMLTLSAVLYLLTVGVAYLGLRVTRRKLSRKIQVNGKGVLITGCDTGFGHDLARRLDERGFTVFAGCLNANSEGAKKLKRNSSKRLHVVDMDVTRDESVARAHYYVLANHPPQGLWAIVNNAGLNVMGDVEWCTVNLYQKAMDVNFYGAVRTIRTFLHLVRETKGRVAVVTSVKGLNPWPADSAYHVTKHSLETLTDSLRLEMKKFGVKVAIIEPGAFALATSCQNENVFQRYGEEIEEMWGAATDEMRATYGRQYLDGLIEAQRAVLVKKDQIRSTRPVIEALEDALVNENPHTRYLVPGSTGWIDIYAEIGRMHHFLPTWLTDFIITRMTGCDRFPADPTEKDK